MDHVNDRNALNHADPRRSPSEDPTHTKHDDAGIPGTGGPLGFLAARIGDPAARKILQRRLQQRQAARTEAVSPDRVHEAAAMGTSGASGPLPHLDVIQKSFGKHDVSGIRAHTDEVAAAGAKAMGAEAFATGEHVAFAGTPSLHTAAHEAAHVVQQRSGVMPYGGVGREGDALERHADAVADAVVEGRSAGALLSSISASAPSPAPSSGGGAAGRAVQRVGGEKFGIKVEESEHGGEGYNLLKQQYVAYKKEVKTAKKQAIREFQESGKMDDLETQKTYTAKLKAAELTIEAQDGLRVRACAGAPSFRRAESLEALRQQAALHVKAVLAQGDDPSLSRRQKAASQAAAKALQQRVERAMQTLSQIQQSPDPPKTPRASTTDPEARVMKMPDGGFRPAYNVQLATAGSPEGGPRTIVGVRVTHVGSDMNAVKPMLEDIARRTGQTPKTLLADANHTAHAGLVAAAARGVEALIAVPEPSKAPRSRHARQDEVTTDWRARMQTDEAKEQMRGRGSLAELSNAHMRRFGLDQFLVCGLKNVTTVVLLAALTFDLLQNAARLLSLT